MKKIKSECKSMLASRIDTGCLCIPLTVDFVKTLKRLSATTKGLQMQDKATMGVLYQYRCAWLRSLQIKPAYSFVSDNKLYSLPEWVQLFHPVTLFITETTFTIRSEYGVSKEIPIREFSY